MDILYKIKKVITNPLSIILFLGSKGRLKWISDKVYLRITFRSTIKRRLNLENPLTFNEKLQYLKLYDRNPLYTELVDKYEVRKHVERIIGKEYLIPLIGVWDRFEDIDFSLLPDQFVLKPTHDSGGVVICKDKSKLDIEMAKNKINKSLKRNYYYSGREWPYKNVKPRIICEKYMIDELDNELKDYKFLCFDGKVKSMYIVSNLKTDTSIDFYDREFNHLPIVHAYKNSVQDIKRPTEFTLMIKLAERLSKGIPHVRVDFYNINGKIYFGELTFYNFSGYKKFKPEKYDKIFGDWINIPDKLREPLEK